MFLGNNVRLEYNESLYCEGEGYITDFLISIKKYNDEENGSDNIGSLIIAKLELMGLPHSHAYEYCDRHSFYMHELFQTVLTDVSSEEDDDIEYLITSDGDTIDDHIDSVIYIDTLKVEAQFRNIGYGQAIITMAMDTVGGKPNDLYLVKPFAIEDRDNKKAHTKVKRFWKKLGFKQFRKTEYYFFSPKGKLDKVLQLSK